jgi:phosphoglycolate phosphatase-like HAD superfamily hydrolase
VTQLDPAQPLKDFQPRHEFLVSVDSDGSVFDTMGIKQRECFCPWTIKYFGLQPVALAARECREFADLFSKTRGENRHKTLKRLLVELLPGHPMVRARKFRVPQLPHYFAWVDDPASTLSNEGLRQASGRAAGPARAELELALAWSERVEWAVGQIVRGMPPFPPARQSLQKLQGRADVIVVSGTPAEALLREWTEHDIARYAAVIAGQEMGTKIRHLSYATKGKYRENRVLMVGDAPGDLNAARANNALFYPIYPGNEEISWQRFHDEALDRFFAGRYAGAYEQKLIEAFDSLLPEKPPWAR